MVYRAIDSVRQAHPEGIQREERALDVDILRADCGHADRMGKGLLLATITGGDGAWGDGRIPQYLWE